MRTSAPTKDQPLTQDELRAAHQLQRIQEPFEQALQVDLYRRLIFARAIRERHQRWLASHPASAQCVRRVRLDAKGQVAGWCTQAVMGPRAETPQLALPLNPT